MKQAYVLSTASVRVTVAMENGFPVLRDLYAAGDAWNWMPVETPVALPAGVSTTDGKPLTPSWQWDEQPLWEETEAGTALTLCFVDPACVLQTTLRFEADKGEGPVVQRITLTNPADEERVLRYRDMRSLTLSVTADADTKLYNFTRSKLFGFSRFPGEPLADTGVLEHWFAHNTCFHHNICNEYANNIPTNYPMLPFEVYRTETGRGLYFGHEFAFGRFVNLCEEEPRRLTHETYLWDAGRLTMAAGESIPFPPAYLGAYVGDLDTAGNQFKRWFWHRLPRSVRENPCEPLVQVDCPQREDELKDFLHMFPVKEMGFEIGKIDISWLDGTMMNARDWPQSDMERITHWEPHPEKWPNGMTAGRIFEEEGLRFALWMSDTYCRAQIGTKEGREAEKEALLSRSLSYGFDTWRSDFELENDPFDYRNHMGFLEILDYMIANRPNFRYEHCAGAAALKDFSTLQRINVYTSEDGASALRHRKTFYTNSFMIPPVQIKADIAPLCRMPLDDGIGEPDPIHNAQYARYAVRSGFLGAHQSCMPVELYLYMGPMERGDVRLLPYYTELVDGLKLYKERMRPILRQGDVYHVLPMADNVNWDGAFIYNTYLEQGALLAFKPSPEAVDGDNKCVALKGLTPTARYRCEFQDHPMHNATYTGAELMEGLWVYGLSGRHASEIVWITREDG